MLKRIGWQAGLALAFIALGFVVIGFAWNGAASKDCVQCQLPYVISGGAVGLGLISLGAALLLFEAGRRVIGRLEHRFEALTEAVREGGAQTAGEEAVTPAALDGMVVVGRSSFHRPDCRLVAGKEGLDYASPDEAAARGLSPCRICDPASVGAR